jgi:hypothetical protein
VRSPGNYASRAQFTVDGESELRQLENCSLHWVLVGQPERASSFCTTGRFGVPKLSRNGAPIELVINLIPEAIKDQDGLRH